MQDQTPFWKGRLFKPSTPRDHEADLGFGRRLDRFGYLTGVRLEALPFTKNIDEAAEACPKAERDLRMWADAWNSSFPSWEEKAIREAQRQAAMRDEATNPDSLKHVVAKFLESEPSDEDAWIAYRLEKTPRVTPSDTHLVASPDTMLARTLRSARSFVAALDLPAYCTAFHIFEDGQNRSFTAILATNAVDGSPRLEGHLGRHPSIYDVVYEKHCESFSTTSDYPFWDWKFLRPHLDRTVVGWTAGMYSDRAELASDNFRFEARQIVLGGALADLAAQGEDRALLTMRESAGGMRQFTVEIGHIRSIQEGGAVLSAVLPENCMAATVEKLEDDFTSRRYFLYGGEIVGSAVLDTDFTPYDGRSEPFVERDGLDEYAREIAALLADNGIADCAFDIALKGAKLKVLSVCDLWNCGFLSFDPAMLYEKVRADFTEYDTVVEDRLAYAVHETLEVARLASTYLEIMYAFGRDNMIAHMSAQTGWGWDAPLSRNVVMLYMVGMIADIIQFAASERRDVVTGAEESFAEDAISDYQRGPFHEWLWSAKEAADIVAKMDSVGSP